MVRSPSRRAVRAIRQAISPRLAMRTEANMGGAIRGRPTSPMAAGIRLTALLRTRRGPGVAAGWRRGRGGTSCTGVPGFAGGVAGRAARTGRRGCAGAAADAASLGAAPLLGRRDVDSGTMMLTGGIDADDGTSKPGGTGLAPELDTTGCRLAPAPRPEPEPEPGRQLEA